MDTSRWQRIEALFDAVADEAPGPARRARLEALCDGDGALADEVAALLDEEQRLSAGDGGHDPRLGLRLGAYEVVRPVAHGGMATVYEGRRADGAFDQRVAIKIMDLRLHDAELLARFRAERQILAALEHPGVTRLFDGGVTTLGEPYLVMEFVDGTPIDRHCDERRLDLPGRVDLVRAVCDGLSFAHRALVLHRDLKPSNILVTAGGHVKIVDFGTATLLQPERLATVSAAPLTPAYASPEQLTGRPVGTASDQYSLGLVLYELLTGAAPFGDRASLLAAIERAMAGTTTIAPDTAITEQAAASRQASLARLRRVLSQDLGTILRKATAPDQAARYASVQHFSDDLGRWLRGEPIEARPPSIAYRTTRFVQRHWVASLVAATLSTGLAATTVLSIRAADDARAQEARARLEEVRAQSESTRASKLSRFLTEMLASASPIDNAPTAARSGSLTVRELVDAASQEVTTTLAGSPDVEAEMRRTLGRTYLGIGVLDRAEAQFDRALVLYRQTGDRAGAASTLALQGRLRVLRGEWASAAPFLREAVAIERSLGAASDPTVLTDAINNLALTITSNKPADPEAIALLRESVRIADERGLQSANVVAMAQALGNQLMIGGALEESETVLRDALARADRLAPDHPTRLYVLRSLSELMRTRGNATEAARVGQDAVEGAARAWPPDYPFQWSFLATWGRALALTDDLDRAMTVLLDAEARARKIRAPGHSDFASIKLGMGTVWRRRGRLTQAEAVLREALAILARFPEIRHTRAHVLGELGLTVRASGRAAEGMTLLQESYDIYLGLLGDHHPFTVTARARLQGADD